MSKQSVKFKSKDSKPSCECQRDCECKTCPDVLQKLNTSPSPPVCNHGTRPKCKCENIKPKRLGACELCSLDEPEPVPDPERTQSFMNVMKYQGCACKVVTRALRADVHRYLGMVDRHKQKPKA